MTESSASSSEPHFDGAGALQGRMLHVSRLATIGEMAAGIAHELNQPLTAIANYAQACERLLGRPDSDLQEMRQALREIASQAVRAGEIIHRLRSLARNVPVERLPTDVNSVVTEILGLMQADARVHRARLILELGEDLAAVAVDRVQMQHVLLNLVRNSLEALSATDPASRTVTLRTSATEAGQIEIAVCDNGPGLSREALERLFDPFFSTKQNGTGLGLPISNTVVRAHGGTLGHHPNRPCGACFYIRLPTEAAE
ncbi:MAG TPA: ATP-binding protein [Steroidobacteraceae bacterium]|nr:ATP-binding protein [Steroidobacteraceae bacterium]